MGEPIGQRPENLGNIIKATRSHYENRAITIVGNPTSRRQAACLSEIERAITAITKKFGIGSQEITLYTYPRGNPNLTPVPVTRPGLIPHQQIRTPHPDDRTTAQTAAQEQTTEIIDHTISLEELQNMSGTERAKKIRDLRGVASISRQTLAKMTNVAENTLVKIERNTQGYQPSNGVLEAIAKGLTTALERSQNTEEQLLKDISDMTAQGIVYALLNARKIPQKELARRIGRSESWVDKVIGRKVRRLTREHVKEICDAIGLKDDDPFKLRLLEQIDIEEDERRLAERARRTGSNIVFQA